MKSDIEASSDEAALRVGLSSKGSKKIAGFWGAYSKALEEHPIRVKSATSFFGFLFGDVVAQLVVGNPYNYLRTARMVVFGILMDGPVGKFSLYGESLFALFTQYTFVMFFCKCSHGAALPRLT